MIDRQTLKQKAFGLLLVLPSFFVICLLVVYPIFRSVTLSFSDPETHAFSLINYRQIFTEPFMVGNIKYTLIVVAFTVLITAILSYLLALYITFTDSWFSRAISRLYIIPRFIPTIVAVYAIMNVVKDTGALNRIFVQLFHVDFKPSLMYTPQGIILANCWFNVPFSVMLIGASLQGIPRSIIESARDVGAGKLRVFLNMILPLSLNDFLIAVTFVFMGNVASFTTPYLMGARSPMMLGVALQQEFSSFLNMEKSAAISVFLFLLSSLMGGFYIYKSLKANKWEVSDR
ncbi:MAG: ABC transporter permease [Spirochaetia bacterium]|jgi:ABC-type spermidine/putrescine transport system permease subunit I